MVIFTGPTITIETDYGYGSESSVNKLAEEFKDQFNVFVVSTRYNDNEIINTNGIYHISVSRFFSFNINAEIVIISRYLKTYREMPIHGNYIYLWLHDIIPSMPSFQRKSERKEYIENTMKQLKIRNIITLSPWHKEYFRKNYGLEDKINIIGNGINPKMFNNEDKQKYKFIWTSSVDRGLIRTLDYIIEIKKVLLETEIHIYRDCLILEKELERFKEYPFIHFHGKVSNQKLIKQMQSSDVWFYPTSFYETYCISALEAQACGLRCICSKIGALSTTMSDERGFFLTDPTNKDLTVNEVITYLQSSVSEEKSRVAKDWALKQTWKERRDEWYKLYRKSCMRVM